MREAIIISIGFHVAVMVAATWGLPAFAPNEEPTEMVIIPVEAVKIGDVTKLKPKAPKVEKAEDKKPPKPKEKVIKKAASLPPPPPAQKSASTMPLPDLDAKPKPKPKKKQVAEVDNKTISPKVSPKSKPRPPSRFKTAALLDKFKDREEEKSFGEKLSEKNFEGPRNISDIDREQQTLSLIDAIRKQIYDRNCWSIPAGAKEAENLKVTIRVRLRPDGTLARAPEVVEKTRMNAPGQEFFRTAAESALRAVRKCVPFELPREKYDLWQDTEIVFDPKEILTG